MTIQKALFLITALPLCVTLRAAEFAKVDYLCCDWGPAMKLPAKTGEKPQFSETEEEVYFLKQLGTFTRGASGNQGHGINIYLCKMKPDGTEKMEIKELWHNVRYPIDTQAQSTWMDLNTKTRKIVLSITYAGSDLIGLWTLELDGRGLKRIHPGCDPNGDVDTVNHPSWTPDGKWIVFDQQLKGPDLHQYRIARCNSDGSKLERLTVGPDTRQPSVSPAGDKIAYVTMSTTQGGLWMMNIDGSNQHLVPNPENQRKARHSGIYPTWSRDGKKILIIAYGSRVIDSITNKTIFYRRPRLQGNPEGTCGWPHWGRLGIIGYNVGGILFTDQEFEEAKWIGSSRVAECNGETNSCRW